LHSTNNILDVHNRQAIFPNLSTEPANVPLQRRSKSWLPALAADERKRFVSWLSTVALFTINLIGDRPFLLIIVIAFHREITS
jgi:hypothetical protein